MLLVEGQDESAEPMTRKIELALIYGSTREGRFCDTVGPWVRSQIEALAGLVPDLIDPARVGLASTEERLDLKRRIDRAEAFVVVTPEYNHSYPAPLKALIDSVHAEWRAKPVAFVSYGGVSGGLRAVEHLRLVFAELHAVGIRDGVELRQRPPAVRRRGSAGEPRAGAKSHGDDAGASRLVGAGAERRARCPHLSGGRGVSRSDTGEAGVARARVLVLGRSPEVLETVMQELAELGIAVEGSVDAEHAAERFDASALDLIVFGGGLIGPVGQRLRRAFARQSPDVRFLDTCAPQAVHRVVAALSGESERLPVDLDAYCARIGYKGPLTPTLETLRALVERHPAAIVFEAIDVLLDRGIDLSPAAVDAKLIGSRRGGYCYEQNSLFLRVLRAIGFEVQGLVGRVRWQAPPGAAPRPRTHMALRVRVDGAPWLADVGFGGCVPTAPLRMDRAEPQATRHEAFRVLPFGDALLVQASLEGRWISLYELSPEPQQDVDYELPNWFTSTHPRSHFRHRLIVSRVTPDARSTLLDGRLTVRTVEGQVDRRVLDATRIEQALVETFGLPVAPDWRPAIARAAAAAA